MRDNKAGDVTVQKRRVRADHSGSVTRLIGQLDKALESADTCRLKQIKQSLIAKLSIISRLETMN